MIKWLFSYQMLGRLARLLRWLLSKWLILLLVGFFVIPVGPHLRTSYTYRGDQNYRAYVSCTYLGAGGYQTFYNIDCPLFLITENKRDPN